MEPGLTSRAILFYCYQRQLHNKRIGVTELADILETSKPNISQLIKQLSGIGYLDHKPYQPLVLTQNGLLKAGQLYKRILILESHLFKTLAMPFFQCRAEAFSWELGIYNSTLDAIYNKAKIETGLIGDPLEERGDLDTKPVYQSLIKSSEKELHKVVAIRNLGLVDNIFLPELSALYLEDVIIAQHIPETGTVAIISNSKKYLLPDSIAGYILVKP